MPTRRNRFLLLLTVLVPLLACSEESNGRDPTSDGTSTTSDGGTTSDGTPVGKELSWLKSTQGAENTGKYAYLARSGGKMGLVYFHEFEQGDWVTVICQPTSPGEQPGPKSRPTQDIYYIQHDGTDWSQPVKVDQTYGPTFGLSLTMDSSGTAHVGYLGGELSLADCSSSDAMIASSSDGQSWNSQTVSGAGGTGDTVGHWMSVAVDSSGTVHSAYRDVHFGYYEQDGNTKASLWYDGSDEVVPGNGAGVYATLAFDPQDQPVIAFLNSTKMDASGGIQLAFKNGSTWTTQQIRPGSTGERPDLDTDGNGLFGLAYYDPGDEALFYKESAADLTAWDTTQVDTNLTRNGEYSSLAYDSQGNPGISYYRCGDYGQSCNDTKDALMFAYRQGGTWEVYEVDTGGEYRCGMYTSLVFNANDQPVIAYQCVNFDNVNQNWIDTLKVATGVYK